MPNFFKPKPLYRPTYLYEPLSGQNVNNIKGELNISPRVSKTKLSTQKVFMPKGFGTNTYEGSYGSYSKGMSNARYYGNKASKPSLSIKPNIVKSASRTAAIENVSAGAKGAGVAIGAGTVATAATVSNPIGWVVAGSAILGVSLWAAYQNAQIRKSQKQANANIGYFPGLRTIIAPAPPPRFTGGQGEGVQYTFFYRTYERVDNNDYYNRELRLSSQVYRAYGSLRGKITDIWAEINYERQAEIANPDPWYNTPGKGVYFKHENGNRTYSFADGYSYGIKFVGLTRLDGQPDNDGNIDTGDDITASSDNIITIRKVPVLDGAGKLQYYLTLADDVRYNPLPRGEIPAEDLEPPSQSVIIKTVESQKFIPPSKPKNAVAVKPPDNKITDSLRNTIEGLLGGKAVATDIETLKQQVAETNRELDRINNKEGLNVDINNSVVSIPEQKSPDKKKEEKQKIVEPEEKVSWKRVGNPVTGMKWVKTVETTDRNGVKETISYDPETGEIYGNIKRTIPGGVTVRDYSISKTPFNLNDDNKYIEKENAFSRGRPKLKEFGKIGSFYPEKTIEDGKKQPKVVGRPTNTGIGVKTASDLAEVTQTPEDLLDQPTLQGKDIAAVAALIAAMPTQTNFIEAVETAVETATCRSTQSGCMRTNVTDPITNNQNNILDALGLGADAGILGVVQDTNNAVRNTTYGLESIQNFAAKAWEATHMDKVISLMNLWVSTHNAAMLSRNLVDTIAELGTQTFNLFGIKNPATGEAIDVSQFLNKSFQSIIETMVPEAIRTDISTTWKKLNRIHNAAVATASAITQTKDAVLEVQEITSDWVANIGNSLQEQGIVEEDSYPWMNNNNDFTNPYSGFLNKVNNAQEIVEQASSFVSSVQELVDSSQGVIESSQELREALAEFSETKQEEEADKDLSSQSPAIDRLDLIQLEPDEI